jgi:hypothetical protein
MNERGILEIAKATGQADIAPGTAILTGRYLARLSYADFELDADYFLSVKEEGGNYLYPLYGDDNALEVIAIRLATL